MNPDQTAHWVNIVYNIDCLKKLCRREDETTTVVDSHDSIVGKGLNLSYLC